jgi:Spy/CpxP family protein refolding chaperone
MRTLIAFSTLLFTLFFTPLLLAEPQEKPCANPGHPPFGGMRARNSPSNSLVRASSGFWLERKVTNPEFMKKIGITEEQATKLKESWKLIEAESSNIEEEIRLLARQQAEHVKKALAEEGSDTTAIMDVIEKIGKLRIDQAKLAMKRVILIRDHLTPEQRKLLNKVVEEDQQKWRAGREESQRHREHKPGPPPPERKQE